MIRRVVLLRHAPAEVRDPARWPDDDRRPLTTVGRRDARRVSEGLRAVGVRPDHILSSPASRALDTARIAARAFSVGPARTVDQWEELSPGAEPLAVLERLARERSVRGTVLLVGHEPLLGRLLGLIVYGEPVAAVRLRRAGAASVELPGRAIPGAGRLDWLLTRRQLTALAGSAG
ncbi:MAG TPA: histidine phosphatase family protein [Thermoplasmata archaeon]